MQRSTVDNHTLKPLHRVDTTEGSRQTVQAGGKAMHASFYSKDVGPKPLVVVLLASDQPIPPESKS
jgi:hypothetical protein